MSTTSRASSSVTLRRALGSNFERANPQKSQSALQMFVIANCRYPGPPWSRTSPINLNTLFFGRTTGGKASGPAGAGAGLGDGAGLVNVPAFIRKTDLI